MKSSIETALLHDMQGMVDAVSPQCILCGGNKRRLLRQSGFWKIHACEDCGLGILDPRPRKDFLPILYQKEYFASQYDTGVEPDSPEFNRWLDLLGHRVRFFRRLKRRGKLLDIGCGNGYFLALCKKRGYEVQGIDISAWAANYASSKLGITVKVGELEDIQYSSEFFDIVTMWHTLEHMGDPVKMILKVRSWLKPEGILVIEVPNYIGTDALNEADQWIGWQIPFHLFHFTPQALAKLLEQSGFRIVKFKDFHSETVKNTLKEYPIISLFARTIAKFFSGHSIAVVAQKIKPGQS